jgi:peptidoglycan/LPS O-acetylase OafA/YrhL
MPVIQSISRAGANRLDHLDAIRGLAAMAVCVFHLSHGGKLLPNNSVLTSIPRNGYLGVEVFFVLSGFVVPWMLWRTEYKLTDFGRFFAKRMVRLSPPFLIANLFICLLNIASRISPWFAGSLEPIDYCDMVLSFVLDATYLTGILQRPWISVVAWTLAIEVQFYLVAGLFMGVMPRHSTRKTAFALILLAMLGAVITDERFVIRYLPFFVLGWSGAFFLNHRESWLPCMTAVVVAAIIHGTTSGLQLCLAIATLLIIVFWKRAIPRWLVALGTISYSLYLLHVPVGGRVINLGLRFVASGSSGVFAVIGVGIALSIVLSAVYWRMLRFLPSNGAENCSRNTNLNTHVMCLATPRNRFLFVGALLVMFFGIIVNRREAIRFWIAVNVSWTHFSPEPIPRSKLPEFNNENTLVLLALGQSNAASHGCPRSNAGANCFAFHDGRFFLGTDPWPGGSGRGGSVWSRFAPRAMDEGLAQNVVVACIAQGSTSVRDWIPGTDCFSRAERAISLLRTNQLNVDYIIWHQGESDVIARSGEHQKYANRLNSVIDGIRASGVDAPFVVCQVSTYRGTTAPAIRLAQLAVCDDKRNVLAGPDTDTFGPESCYAGVHFNASGFSAFAEGLLSTMKQHANGHSTMPPDSLR